MFSGKNLVLSFAIVLLLVPAGLAQENEPGYPEVDSTRLQRQGRFNRGDRPGKRGRQKHLPRLSRLQQELALTDAQQDQLRNAAQLQFESTKLQREELMQLGEKSRAGTLTADDAERAKALHEEMRASRKKLRTEVESILTEEQRTKLEELGKERRLQREERMSRRLERRSLRP